MIVQLHSLNLMAFRGDLRDSKGEFKASKPTPSCACSSERRQGKRLRRRSSGDPRPAAAFGVSASLLDRLGSEASPCISAFSGTCSSGAWHPKGGPKRGYTAGYIDKIR